MTTKKTSDDGNGFRRYMDENQALPPGCMLGYAVWYGVGDSPYDAKVLEDTFTRLGLNDKFLPGAINPADAFEKATKERGVDGIKYSDPKGTGHQMQIIIRDVARTPNQIVRRMVREDKDQKAKELKFTEVGEFVFSRPKQINGVVDHSTVRVRSTLFDHRLAPGERPLLEEAVKTFDAAYERYRDYYDAQRVRKIIRDYLGHLNAILLKKSGGVYFVHATRSDELEALAEFLNSINPTNPTTQMVLLPLPELAHLREEVTEAFEREAENNLLGIVEKVDTLLATRKGPIRDEAYKKIHAEYEDVMVKASEYARTLQCSQDRTGAAAEIAMMKLATLQEIVLKGERDAA